MNHPTKLSGWIAAATALWLTTTPVHAALRASGTVLDTDNQPIAGVMVRVWDVNPGKDTNIVLGEAATDAQGQFSIRYRDHRDPGPFHRQPDIRITVETPAQYSTGNWFDRPGMATFATVGTLNDAGKNTILTWWPGFNQQANDYDVTRDINLLPGMLIVERNRWESVRTGFDPLLHGFNFTNPKRNICWGPTCQGMWGPIFTTKQTLCGGMSLTVLKKYVAGRCDTYWSYAEIPKENADGNRLPPALKEEIVTNQIETFTNDPYVSSSNLDINLDLLQRPPPNFPGLRFLDWQQKQEVPGSTPGPSIGAATKAQWPLIRDHLHLRKLPVILGLVHARARAMNFVDVDLVSTNHQVLAIGYDFNPHYRTGTLYIHDPNYPGQIRELKFKEQLRHSIMYIDYDARKTRGFFLNVGAPASERAPAVQCPPPVRQQNLQLTHLELRDASALDIAAPKSNTPFGLFARVKNVGADHVSGQVRVECGLGAPGESIASFAHHASESVQLGSGRHQWIRVGLPASTGSGQQSAKCRTVLDSAQGDSEPGNNELARNFTVLAPETELGSLSVTPNRPSWTRPPFRPFDRAVSIRIANNGRFMAHPEGASSLRLRCTVIQMPWVSVIAMPGESMPPEIKLAASQIPNPNGTTDVELLLHSVVKPGFPSTRQLSGTLNFACTTFVGNFVDGPSRPKEVQPLPPVGPAIWKGSAMFTVVNDEHTAN